MRRAGNGEDGEEDGDALAKPELAAAPRRPGPPAPAKPAAVKPAAAPAPSTPQRQRQQQVAADEDDYDALMEMLESVGEELEAEEVRRGSGREARSSGSVSERPSNRGRAVDAAADEEWQRLLADNAADDDEEEAGPRPALLGKPQALARPAAAAGRARAPPVPAPAAAPVRAGGLANEDALFLEGLLEGTPPRVTSDELCCDADPLAVPQGSAGLLNPRWLLLARAPLTHAWQRA
jgi:hypothetical protein